MTTELEPRTQKFLDHYHSSFNLPESWRAAGLKPQPGETVAQSAANLLCSPVARDYLIELSRRATKPANDQTEGGLVISELQSIAKSKITDVCNWDATGNVGFKASTEIDDKTAAAIETLRIEMTQFGPKIMVKMHSKQAALTTLARYYNVDVDLNSLLDRVRSYDYEPIDAAGQADEED
jgi:hypothetical protein